MLFLLKPKDVFVNQTKGKITLKSSHGQNEFSYELTFWFISIINSGQQKSKSTLRVEITQFCDGIRDIMRSSYVIDKICGVELPHPLLEK